MKAANDALFRRKQSLLLTSLPGAAMIADEKAARQKTLKIVRFSRFFAMYAAKTSAYETWGKDNILWLLFCELSKKTGFELPAMVIGMKEE